MPEITLNKKQECDKQQECNQYFMSSFIMLLVQTFIAAIYKYRNNDKCNQKQYCKYGLACGKHAYNFKTNLLFLTRDCIIWLI